MSKTYISISDDNIQNHFVRILYRNTTKIEDPHVLYIPHCGYRCPLERFAQLYRDIMPVNWEDECAPKVDTLHCLYVSASKRVNSNNHCKTVIRFYY